MQSCAFRWFSAAALVFCSLVFFPNSGIKVGGSCVLCMEKILTVHILCDIFLLYTVLCRIGKLNVFFSVLRIRIRIRIHQIHMFLGPPHFRCQRIQENQAIDWFLKTKEKNPLKQEILDFLETIVQCA